MVQLNYQGYSRINRDTEILNWIQEGVPLTFHSVPPRRHLKNAKQDLKARQFIDGEVKPHLWEVSRFDKSHSARKTSVEEYLQNDCPKGVRVKECRSGELECQQSTLKF